MKIKLIVILFAVFFSFDSSIIYANKPKGKIHYIDFDRFQLASKEDIRLNLEMKLNKYDRGWDKSTIKWAVNVLHLGEIKYKIDHRIILTIMDIESNLDHKAKRYNKNRTWDKGICQVNDVNIYEYKRAAKILEDSNIWYSSINNRHDIGLNILSAYIYFDWSRASLMKDGDFSKKRMIVSYNCGLNGSNEKDYKYLYLRNKRESYWNHYVEAERDFTF